MRFQRELSKRHKAEVREFKRFQDRSNHPSQFDLETIEPLDTKVIEMECAKRTLR